MTVTAVRLGGRPDLPLLVLGPSLGTSATTLWSAAAQHLARSFQVVAWDLPGHGTNRFPLPEDEPLTVSRLAADVLELVDSLVDGFGPARFHYAGDSVGGAVGLQLLLDAPQRVSSATLLCTGARIGSDESWQERIETVRASGTPGLVSASATLVGSAPASWTASRHAARPCCTPCRTPTTPATPRSARRSPRSTCATGFRSCIGLKYSFECTCSTKGGSGSSSIPTNSTSTNLTLFAISSASTNGDELIPATRICLTSP